MDIEVRQKDILTLIDKIDITPTMYLNATEKYKQLAQYLADNGIDAEIYPQGSFALGTVVRPITKIHDATYDLDFVCQVHDYKDTLSPLELRDKVLEILQNSRLYDKKLKICDECFTVEYADTDGAKFSIDIVPAVSESSENIARLMTNSIRNDLVESAIAIPKQINKEYSWLTSNPKGYKIWFEEINNKFNETSKFEYRRNLFESNKQIFSSIQEVPDELDRSALQRVIQILKLHRDIYYSFITEGDKFKPISAIINTIVAQIANTAVSNISVFDLLQYVLEEMAIYSNQQTLDEMKFAAKYNSRSLILKKGSSWIISNPANPEDNLANQWTDTTAKIFFRWVETVRNDLISSLQLPDERFRSTMENAFGKQLVSKSLGTKYQGTIVPKPISRTSVAKPWKM